MSDTEIDYRIDMYITYPKIYGSATASVKNELFYADHKKGRLERQQKLSVYKKLPVQKKIEQKRPQRL